MVSRGHHIKSIDSGEVTVAEYDCAYGYKTVVTLADGTEFWGRFLPEHTTAVSMLDRRRGGTNIKTS